MTVYFTTIFEGYHLRIKLLKKYHNFKFPAKTLKWVTNYKTVCKTKNEVSSNVPIFLSIVNKFYNSIIDFERPTLNIAFGGKIKIVNFFKQLDF